MRATGNKADLFYFLLAYFIFIENNFDCNE